VFDKTTLVFVPTTLLLFQFSFHTSFIPENRLILSRDELDFIDTKSFPMAFSVQMDFTDSASLYPPTVPPMMQPTGLYPPLQSTMAYAPTMMPAPYQGTTVSSMQPTTTVPPPAPVMQRAQFVDPAASTALSDAATKVTAATARLVNASKTVQAPATLIEDEVFVPAKRETAVHGTVNLPQQKQQPPAYTEQHTTGSM